MDPGRALNPRGAALPHGTQHKFCGRSPRTPRLAVRASDSVQPDEWSKEIDDAFSKGKQKKTGRFLLQPPTPAGSDWGEVGALPSLCYQGYY